MLIHTPFLNASTRAQLTGSVALPPPPPVGTPQLRTALKNISWRSKLGYETTCPLQAIIYHNMQGEKAFKDRVTFWLFPLNR